MSIIFLEIIFTVLLIALAGLLSAAEMAIASFGINKIEEMKEKGDKIALSFEKIQSISELFFGTIQISTIIFISCSVILSYDLNLHLLNLLPINFNYKILSLLLTIIISTPFIIIFSVLLPKSLGFKYSEKIGRSFVKIILFFTHFYKIPIKIINFISNFVLIPFNERTGFTQTRFSEDEIKIIISEGVKSGALDETEQKIIQNVFEFNDLKANEVLRPRTSMMAIDINENREEIKNIIFNCPHLQIPVFEKSLDNIIGMFQAKLFLKAIIENESTEIKKFIKPAYFIPENKLISEVLREMQKYNENVAIVMDEYGGTEGFITLEDLIGEIVGEIRNSNIPVVQKFKKNNDGSYLVLGEMYIDDFNITFNSDLPVSEEYNTVAGFVADKSGKILNKSEKLSYGKLVFELTIKERQKMVEFRVNSLDGRFGETAPKL